MANSEALNQYPAMIEPPTMPGALPLIGHMLKFAKNPYEYMKQIRATIGEIAQFKMFHQEMILLTGNDASEFFYRGTDEHLDQSAAYKVMTPIFGHGVVFDAPNHIKNQQLKMLMPALRDKPMRTYSELIVEEVENMIKHWGESGEVDINVFMKELTIYTSSRCLLGEEFRFELNEEFAKIYHDLERGVTPLAYVFPNLPLPSFKKRDKARVRLQELVTGIMEKRARKSEKNSDAFQMLIDSTYEDGTKLTPHEITGMLIGTIFAGHHTSSGTAAWVLIELLRHPEHMISAVNELEEIFADNSEVTFQSLRQIPKLENVIKEVLRLHPPLIMLMRQVTQDLQFKDYLIKAGKFVVAAPPVTHKLAELFANPELFDPERYNEERAEDKKNFFAWQAFGGGKHKCSGNAFAMFQIKAIFAVLLRRYEFELVDAPASYQDDYTKMVVQPAEPCRIRYRKRSAAHHVTNNVAVQQQTKTSAAGQCPFSGAVLTASGDKASHKIAIDQQLCQGHGVCMGESPEIFKLDNESGMLTVLQKNIGDKLLAKAKNAEKFCPNQAIKVTALN